MAVDKITFTGKLGPGNAVTSLVLENVREFNFKVDRQVIEVIYNSGKVQHFDLYDSTTVTYTIAARVATVTVTNA